MIFFDVDNGIKLNLFTASRSSEAASFLYDSVSVNELFSGTFISQWIFHKKKMVCLKHILSAERDGGSESRRKRERERSFCVLYSV